MLVNLKPLTNHDMRWICLAFSIIWVFRSFWHRQFTDFVVSAAFFMFSLLYFFATRGSIAVVVFSLLLMSIHGKVESKEIDRSFSRLSMVEKEKMRVWSKQFDYRLQHNNRPVHFGFVGHVKAIRPNLIATR